MKIQVDDLSQFCIDVFKRMDMSSKHALLATDVLKTADLRGVDSHGVARLSGYVRLWEAGRVNTKPNIKIIHEKTGTATLDADQALGLIVAPYAMELAIEKAQKVGSGWIAVKNSNHFGIAGYHSMLASEKNCIGIATTNASPLVAPTFSKERMLGTNPFAYAIPTLKEPVFVADFATATIANGKLEILEREQKSCPIGWLQTQKGEVSEDPSELKKGGSLLPLGSDRIHSSHKGFCLSAVADILSGVLSGAAFGPWAPPFVSFLPVPEPTYGNGLGHFLGAIAVDAFQPVQDFKENMDVWIQRFRKATPIDEQQPVLIPGDLERITHQKREKEGVLLHKSVWDDLETLTKKFNLPSIKTKGFE